MKPVNTATGQHGGHDASDYPVVQVNMNAVACQGCGLPLYGEPECSWCARQIAHQVAMSALVDVRGELTVRLASVGNPDFGQNSRQSLPGVPRLTVRVATLRAASEICREYIRHHELGGGNWIGGEVKRGKVVVARISYNGRAWAAGDKRHELPLDGEV